MIDVGTLVLVVSALVLGYGVGVFHCNREDRNPELARRLAHLEQQHAETARLADQQSTVVCDMAKGMSHLGHLAKDHEKRLKAVEGRAWLN